MADFIKEGGYCVTAFGDRAGPMERHAEGIYSWRARIAGQDIFDTWTANGRFIDDISSSNYDLVAEWVEPAPTVAPAEPDYERLADMWQAYLQNRDIYAREARAMLRILEIIQEDDNGNR